MDDLMQSPSSSWQIKCLEPGNLSLSSSDASGTASSTKVKTSSPRKTPKKTPGKSPKTSSGLKLGAASPSSSDRFIPSRSAIDFDLNQFKMVQQQQLQNHEDEINITQREKQNIMTQNLSGEDISHKRILVFQNKSPSPLECHQNSLKVPFSHLKNLPLCKRPSRLIPQTPDRILDAPDLMDDYYLNLVDWNSNNILAVALSEKVYLWYADTGEVKQLLSLEGNAYVCSLAWTPDGVYLAVGTSTTVVQLWDCSAMKRLRILDGHTSRVCSLSWNEHILSSGSRSGHIVHHDVRQQLHAVAVCGLKWSPDGSYLASGGNDNVLNIWPNISAQLQRSSNQPLHTFRQHQAAVKALAWCPWQQNLLASGGGTADRCIRFWNCSSGTCLNSVDTKSQVCSLLWSKTYKEIVSAHGYANNELIVWKYPTMNKVAELTGHTSRVLHLTMSPDGSTVLSAGADETLRFWKCFVPDPAKKKAEGKAVPSVLQCVLR
ncbi:Protein cortex [Gryllus bimaculatus]|nr:Protein cortex [Gryllus bimaculatus]